MQIAIQEAKKALSNNEVPIGCVLVKDGKIICKTHNTRKKSSLCIDHAEIKCITKAEKKLKDWRLDGYEMYVTLKPCQMCTEVIKQCRLSTVYYLAESNFEKNKKKETTNILKLNESEQLEKDYLNSLKNFFKSMRK